MARNPLRPRWVARSPSPRSNPVRAAPGGIIHTGLALSPGTRLGQYEVTAQIGVGGMGEVYQATDTNLKRAVAIKVLPESVASNAERLARFQTRGRSPRLTQPSEHRGHLRSGAVKRHHRARDGTRRRPLAERLSHVGRVPRSGPAEDVGSAGPAGLPIEEALPSRARWRTDLIITTRGARSGRHSRTRRSACGDEGASRPKLRAPTRLT